MSHEHPDKPVPKAILWAALGLMLSSLIFAAVAQWTGYGKARLPDSPIVAKTSVRFEDLGPEGLKMVAHPAGNTLAHLKSGEDGFVRGVLRSLNRIRKLDKQPRDSPFLLIRYQDGRTGLADPNTGESLHLIGYGKTNFQTFHTLASAAENQLSETKKEVH